jgi:glycosyltransferase involved in cell wall biosynthesis
VGDGELRHEITASNIEVTGWIPSSRVNNLLESADLYLSTSLWEGLPLSVLEAMSMSLPLLLSNCVGNKDLVINDKNGYLFKNVINAVEKIIFLNENRSLLSTFGAHSRFLCKTYFDIKKTYKEYEELYYNNLKKI